MNVKTGAGEAYAYIDTAESLSRLIQAMASTNRVGFDTEADSLHHYFDKVCLIQLSFGGKQYIVDPLKDISFQEFFEVLSGKELIIQGADYDLRMLHKTFGFRPKAPVFDTMLAAQILGYDKIGLAALVEKFCGVILPKTGQKSDWSIRPLREDLLKYASDDTKYLETVADALTAELQRLNRLDWHRESCERVVQTSILPGKSEDKEKEAWRVKGSSKLQPKALVFVRELWKWRDEEARQRDRPPFMMMLNENLVALAEWLAENPRAPFAQGPVFLKRISGDKLARLEKAVQTAAALPPSEWPGLPKKKEWREEESTEKRLDVLLAAVKKIADELKVETFCVASRAALTGIAKAQPKSVEDLMKAGGLLRWQAELVMPAIQQIK